MLLFLMNLLYIHQFLSLLKVDRQDHPFREVVFPNIQPEPPLAQLKAIPSSHITGYMREGAYPQLTTSSLQVVIETFTSTI